MLTHTFNPTGLGTKNSQNKQIPEWHPILGGVSYRRIFWLFMCKTNTPFLQSVMWSTHFFEKKKPRSKNPRIVCILWLLAVVMVKSWLPRLINQTLHIHSGTGKSEVYMHPNPTTGDSSYQNNNCVTCITSLQHITVNLPHSNCQCYIPLTQSIGHLSHAAQNPDIKTSFRLGGGWVKCYRSKASYRSGHWGTRPVSTDVTESSYPSWSTPPIAEEQIQRPNPYFRH